MKQAGRFFLAVGIVLTQSGLFQSAVLALEASATPDELWLQNPALVISAYQRTADGTRLQLLELFNESDALVDIRDWTILLGTAAEGVELELLRKQGEEGLIAPKSHAVVEFPDELVVSNASFTVAEHQVDAPVTLLSKVTVLSNIEGVKPQVYELKLSPADKTLGTPIRYDDLWRRAPLTSPGYSSTISSFTVSPTMHMYDDGLYVRPASPPLEIVEVYSHASDCAPDVLDARCFEYIKLAVNESAGVALSDYAVRTDNNTSARSETNTFYLADYELVNGYVTITATQSGGRLNLTNSGGYVWIEDVYEQYKYPGTMIEYAAVGTEQQGWSYMQEMSGVWKWTSTPMPGAENLLTLPSIEEEVVTCPAGKYLNPDTGRCRTIEEAINTLATCGEGEFRNPETNRCKKIAVTQTPALAPCGEGQERNPITNRCRSIASAVAELLPCDEGYERNPETNRCRKVLGATLANAALTSPTSESSKASSATGDSLGWAAVGTVLLGTVAYAVYEWRKEIVTVWGRFATLWKR